MPARTDHDARRRDVSEAVWRVLAVHGFGGLTLRAVQALFDPAAFPPERQTALLDAFPVSERAIRSS